MEPSLSQCCWLRRGGSKTDIKKCSTWSVFHFFLADQRKHPVRSRAVHYRSSLACSDLFWCSPTKTEFLQVFTLVNTTGVKLYERGWDGCIQFKQAHNKKSSYISMFSHLVCCFFQLFKSNMFFSVFCKIFYFHPKNLIAFQLTESKLWISFPSLCNDCIVYDYIIQDIRPCPAEYIKVLFRQLLLRL